MEVCLRAGRLWGWGWWTEKIPWWQLFQRGPGRSSRLARFPSSRRPWGVGWLVMGRAGLRLGPGGQAVAGPVGRPSTAREGIEPVVGPHPQTTVAAFALRQHRRPVEDVAPGHGREPAAGEQGDLASAGAHPEPSSRGGGDGVDVL